MTFSVANRFLTTKEAAEYLAISYRTLEDYRLRGGGPYYFKLGGRGVRYRQADLDGWTERRRTTGDVANETVAV